METAPKQKMENHFESPELIESIEKARELRAQLEEFNDTDVVGSEDLGRVEEIASTLSRVLRDISAEVCLREGLPYHPMDTKSV